MTRLRKPRSLQTNQVSSLLQTETVWELDVARYSASDSENSRRLLDIRRQSVTSKQSGTASFCSKSRQLGKLVSPLSESRTKDKPVEENTESPERTKFQKAHHPSLPKRRLWWQDQRGNDTERAIGTLPQKTIRLGADDSLQTVGRHVYFFAHFSWDTSLSEPSKHYLVQKSQLEENAIDFW